MSRAMNNFEKLTDAEFCVDVFYEIMRRSNEQTRYEDGRVEERIVSIFECLIPMFETKLVECCPESSDSSLDITMTDGSVLHISNPNQISFAFDLSVSR